MIFLIDRVEYHISGGVNNGGVISERGCPTQVLTIWPPMSRTLTKSFRIDSIEIAFARDPEVDGTTRVAC